MFRFSQYEAERLASLNRYLSIVYDCFIVFVFLLFVNFLLHQTELIKRGTCIVSLITVLLVNSYTFYRYLNRASVKASISYRNQYASVVDPMLTLANGENKCVWIITQASDGRDYQPIQYGIRPFYYSAGAYSLAAKTDALYEGDIWTRKISAEEWKKELMSVDYVLIYSANDSFREDYAVLFDNPKDIGNERIYEVNHDTGMLVRVV